jgi:hypothetical protein
VRLDRFSPFHARPEAFGLRNVRAARGYFYAFPLGRREMSRLAYFFDFDYADGRDPNEYLMPLVQAVQGWWETRSGGREAPRLDAAFQEHGVVVTDTRAAGPRTHQLTGAKARILALCDTATTLPSLLRQDGLSSEGPAVIAALQSLVSDRLVLEDGGRFLALPVMRNRPSELGKNGTHVALANAPATKPLLPLG